MTDSQEEAHNAMLDGMADVAVAVAAFTGIRQQFIDAGWSPTAAEQMTHTLVLKSAS